MSAASTIAAGGVRHDAGSLRHERLLAAELAAQAGLPVFQGLQRQDERP